MKNKYTLLIAVLLLAICHPASAQTVIYNQNFDSSPSLPSGWYTSPNSWYIDTTTTNSSSLYTGSSGAHNIAIKDTTARLGADTLITSAISTLGYNGIVFDWGTRFSKHYADSGSTISLAWSVNGTTWNPITYTENTNNSAWALDNAGTPVALPSAANNQASLRLMWVANIHYTPSGSYRIDDLTVSGTAATGISTLSAGTDFAKVFVNSNSEINIYLIQALTEDTYVEVYDLSGRMISDSHMTGQSMTISAKEFSQGMYIVKVYDMVNTMIAKVAVK